jgi:undecaprenyl-diphosphatase
VNDYFLSVLLGVVEGLTEFIPVSSTAHLRLTEVLLNLSLEDSYWKMYSVVIQLGAILAVVVYFWPRIVEFVRTFPRGKNNDRTWLTHPLTLVMGAFVVTAGPAYLLDKKIGKNLENLWVIGGALLIGGIVMWIVDAWFGKETTAEANDPPAIQSPPSHDKNVSPSTIDNSSSPRRGLWGQTMEQMSWPQAIWIGAAQILSAVFPGTSRSMATIAAGQTVGLTRTAALEFSFFLSIPVMFAATGFKLLQAALGKGSHGGVTMTPHLWGVLAVGFIVSFLVAWAVIAWFMAWVRRHGFTPFAIYRIILGIIVLFLARGQA